MAGSISLSLSQQFDELGKPLSGGKLYFIQAGTTSTPQDAFYDYDLTQKLPNPYTLDAAGRIPGFYLADGFIKIRLTDSGGVVQREQDNVLVVGPSSGGGGGGGGVDPTTVFQTGDVMWLDVQGSRTGWVRDNGRTIGSASSGATERANADTSALFVWLWGTFDNTICPVSTGRGASAAADFAANKTIQLPDKRSYVTGGLDDMGNSAASRFANVPVVSGSATDAGSILGEALNTLTSAQLPSHTHPNTLTDPGHTHEQNALTLINENDGTGQNTSGTAGGYNVRPNVNHYRTLSSTTGITITNAANTGGGGAHNNVQKTVLGTFYRKL